MEEILEINSIDITRLLSIKRDAVFVTGPPPSSLVLRDGTKFRSKGSYTSFVKLGGIEVYAVPKRGMADLKGVPPEKRHLHQQFVTRMVLDVLGLLERGSRVEAAHTLQLFRRDYAARKLPLGFYREFNSASSYAVSAGGRVFQLEGEDGIAVDALEIAYNLRNVVVPLVRGIA